MNTVITNNIRITVSYEYQNRYSDDEKQDHVFFYKISIENCGQQKVKLLSQYRKLVDSIRFRSNVEHAEPKWDQPYIFPGETVTYDCACSLRSPIGKLIGHCEIAMIGLGEIFNAPIPETELYATSILN